MSKRLDQKSYKDILRMTNKLPEKVLKTMNNQKMQIKTQLGSTTQEWLRTLTTANVGDDAEHLEVSFIADRTVKW